MVDVVGFAVRNQNRILQIDGEYQNHELLSISNHSIGAWGTTNDMWGTSVDIAPPPGRANVILAIKTTAPAGVYVVRISASVYRVYRGIGNPLNDVISFTAYFFATPIERIASGGVGLVVRNRITGNVVFNSNYRYLRIMQFAPVDLYMPIDANVPPSSASFSFPGKTLAVVQCVRPNGRRQNDAGTPQQPISVFGFFSGTMRTDGGDTATITHRVISTAIGPRGTSVASQTFGTYMIIDVTGY